MGVYLSEPNTLKEIKEGKDNGFVFCKAEMQGTIPIMQAGASLWKTQPSTKPTSATATPSSVFSTATAVPLTLYRPLSQQVRS